MCGLFLFAPLEGVAQKFTVFRKSLSCTIFTVVLLFFVDVDDENFTLRSRMEVAFQAKPWGARSPKASVRNIHLR